MPAEPLADHLLETWAIHDRVQRDLLDAIPTAALAAPPAKGRSVGEQFAHLHNVRLMWLRSAAPDLLDGLAKVEKADAGDKERLGGALEASGRAVAALLRLGLETGRIKGFKPHPVAFLGYLIAHEPYHQGDVGVVLAQTGHPLDRTTAYGMWEWGVR